LARKTRRHDLCLGQHAESLDVGMDNGFWKSMAQDGGCGGIDLTKSTGSEASLMESELQATDTGE
jgi:hypothetical protein